MIGNSRKDARRQNDDDFTEHLLNSTVAAFTAPVVSKAPSSVAAELRRHAKDMSQEDRLACQEAMQDGDTVTSACRRSNPFPNNTFSAANYWVDVVFSPGAALTPPALGNVATSASYSAGGTATTLSSGTTVSDPESTTLVSGTVSIASGFLTGDTLAATTTGTSITASYNGSTGVLSLSGSDTLAHYQQVLDSVGYASSSQNPTNSGADPSRTISWVVNDGALNSATQTTTVNISTPPAPPSITSVALSGGLWKLSGSAAASSTVTVFDGATKLGTTTANSSGGWSFTTTENNSAIRDFFATVTDAAGNTSAASAAWFEGTAGNDVFSFASEAALVAPAAIFGNGGSDTIAITAPATLVDADFAHAHNILTLLLTGASAVTLGASAAAAGVANVSTGNGATSITDSNTGTLNVMCCDCRQRFGTRNCRRACARIR